MIKVIAKEEFIKTSILNILSQKNIIFSVNSENYFSLIKIENLNQSLSLNIDEEYFNFIKPVNLCQLTKTIIDQLRIKFFNFKNLKYFPYQRLILIDTKKVFLTEIQNNIFMSLSLNQDGIDKEKLYKFIWSQDKDISINKLDTHLTNLKNDLSNNLGVYINFQSKDKKLKLIIN